MTITALEIGVLLDEDGVIIDSSRQHEVSWERLAAEEGQPRPADHFGRGFGRWNEYIIPEILQWAQGTSAVRRLSLRKEALYREVVREQGVEALKGGRVFLDRLRAAGIPSWVASSTHRLNVETVLGVLGCLGHLDGLVTAEDVDAGKPPHPAVFWQAAAMIDRTPDRCIVFEDALAGIEASHAGGRKVVGVTTTHDERTLRPLADRVVHRLDELMVEDLTDMMQNPPDRKVPRP